MKKQLIGYTIFVLAVIAAVIWRGLQPPEIGTAEAIQRSNDRLVTLSNVSAPPVGYVNGAGNYQMAVAAARDNNSQFVVYYVNATSNDAGDVIEVYEKSDVTSYQTLYAAFCGGTTDALTLTNNAWTALPNNSGQSIVCIDGGNGKVGWAEMTGNARGTVGLGASGGGVVPLRTGTSNTSLGALLANQTAQPDLSATTFVAGSRVYLMEKTAEINIGAGNVSLESDFGIIAITKDSPALFLVEANGVGNGAGVTIQAITGGYR